ncbi:MAG: hypothetical protein KGL55_05010 [Rhodospirillales bacterium]|nr:hypothetical protein [Rhodospirillales bacterium]
MAPAIAAAAPRIEAESRLPAPLLETLHAARLFRALLPRELDGDECRPSAFVEMMEVLAGADASTAWCIGQSSGCSMIAASLAPDVARAIWGPCDAALAWGAGPQGVARRVVGGYRVRGTWNFASGSRHATWLGGHCRVQEEDGAWREGAGGAPAERTMLFPRAAAAVEENWQVMGLRGTGSDSYAVTDLFVPDAYTVCRDDPAELRHDGLLYRFTTTHLYAAGFGAVAMGIARATLDALRALAAEKTPASTTRTLRDNPVVQTQVALAEAKLGAARAFLLDTLRQCEAALESGAALTLDQRARIRMAATFATHQAREVVDMAYHEAGATAIFNANPFERRFRDMHTVCQQVQARSAHFETVGRHLLGLPAELRWL